MQPVAEEATHARNNETSVSPRSAKKQRTSSDAMSLSTATPSLWRTVLPICAPSSHEYLLPQPSLNVARSTMPMPLPDVTPSRKALPPILICAPPFQNPNLPRFASFGVATHHQTPLLTEVFGFTPFGMYCRVCKDRVGASEPFIISHSKKHGIFTKCVIRTFKIMADKEIERLSKHANLESYLVGRLEGFACRCKAVFAEKKALDRHCKATECPFDPKEATPELLFQSVRGRTLTQATFDKLSSSQLTAEHLDSATTEAALVPLSFNVARNNTSFAHNNHVGEYASPLSVVHPNLYRFASFGVATGTHHPTPRLTALFGFTPFGMYCRVCKDHVGSSELLINMHLERKKHGVFSGYVVNTLRAMTDKEVERLLEQGNLKSYLVDHSEGFSCPCGAVFWEKKVLVRHCKETKCSFGPKEARPELLFKTVCGRSVSQATLHRLSSSLPTAEHIDFATTEAARIGFGSDVLETPMTEIAKTCDEGDSEGGADACYRQPRTDRKETKLMHAANICDSVVETVPVLT
jgi:hypothetical protein